MALKGKALTVQYVAWNTSSNQGQTGDATNHTLKLMQDGVEASPTNAPAEFDAINCPGVYKLALTAADMTFNCVGLSGKSSTANVAIIPLTIVTEQGNLDAAVSSRSTYNGSDTSGTTALLARLTSTRAGNLDNLDAAVSTRLATAGYTSPPSAASIASTLLGTALSAPRALDAVADASLTVNDACHCAIAAAAGKEDASSGTSLVVKTPSTGTTIRTFSITTASNPFGSNVPVQRS